MKNFSRFALVMSLWVVFALTVQAQTETYTATEVRRIDKMAGPARTSAIVAPDGTRYAYIDDQICVYAIADDQEEGCVDIRGLRGFDVRSVRWSPDGRYLVFTEDFLRRFVDSDIYLVDTEDFSLANLTNDFVDRISIGDETWGGNQDFAPVWLSDGRIAFFRLNRIGGEYINVISTMNAEGVDIEPVPFRAEFGDITNYMLAAASSAPLLVYNTDMNMADFALSAANLLNFEEETDTPFLPLADPSLSLYEMQLSFDGSYLLSVDRRVAILQNSIGVVPTNGMTTEVTLLDETQDVIAATFAPDSNAIAYLTSSNETGEQGLYIVSAPGEAPQLLLEGTFISSLNASYLLSWGGDTLLLSDLENQQIVVVKIEKQ
jgi:hypothetical protein